VTNDLHPLRLGLEPLDLAAWLRPRPGDDAILAERAQLLADKADEVMAYAPEAANAVEEIAAMLRGRDLVLGGSPEPVATLRAIGVGLAEDILLLTPRDDRYILTAGVLCFPNRWHLREKVGGDLMSIHAPVPDYKEVLASPVDRFMAKLRPDRAFRRHNWGLASSPARHLPDPVPPVAPEQAENAFLREEEQSFVKLVQSGAVVFTIRTTITPWRDVAETRRGAILQAIGVLSPAWLAYKSLIMSERTS
jgi:hypothetical protein